MITSLRYLGVDIFPSLHTIALKNFQGTYNNVEMDMTHWSLPLSLQAQVSVIKMDILPYIIYLFFLL